MIEDLLAAGLKENADISGFSDIERRLKKDHRALVMYNAVAVDIGMKKHAESDLLAVGISELTNLEKRIKGGIKLSQDYARHKIMLAVAKKQLKQIGELNHNYSVLLVETANRLYAEFSAAHGKMKKLSDAGAVRAKRNHLKHLADLYGEMSLLAEPRRVKLGDMPDVIGIFVRNSYTIKKLEKERGNVLLVRKELESLDLNNRTSRKQLKDCSKKLKGLPEKFARVEYYEGKIETEGLMQQIDYLRSSKAHSVWADLCRYVDALRTDIQHIAHETDLDKLRKLSTGLDSQEYDIYSGVISFKGKIQEYKELVQQFYDAVDGRIKKDNEYKREVSEANAKTTKAINEKAQLRYQVNEAKGHAVKEARNAVKIEKQLSEEKNAVEGQLTKEKQRAKKLEGHICDHEDFKRTCNKLTDQVDYLGGAIGSLEDMQTEQGRRVQSELGRGFEELKKQFEDSKNNNQENTLAEVLGKVSDYQRENSRIKQQMSEAQTRARQAVETRKKLEQRVKEEQKKTSQIKGYVAKVEESTAKKSQEYEQRLRQAEKERRLAEKNGKELESQYNKVLAKNSVLEKKIGEERVNGHKKIAEVQESLVKQIDTLGKQIEDDKNKSKSNYFIMTCDYVNSVGPPDTPEFEAFGNALVGSSCWTDNLYELRKELGRMRGMTVVDGDRPYLKHLTNGLYQSLESGELGKIADVSPDKMEEILETIDLFNEFIGQKQAA